MRKYIETLLIVLILFFLSVTVVLAENKCGVNIGPNYSQVSQVAGMTREGGWVVALGTLGNCNDFEGLFGKGLNVVIRAYNGGRMFTSEEALGWVATLGKLDTKGQVVYFMPWNEPNHDNEGGGSTAGNYVYQYSDTLKKALEDAGLLGTKVILLSPMVDKLNPSFIDNTFFTNPGGKSGFYNLFQGSSINEYDQFSPGPCTAIAPQNNCKYDEIGIPGPYYSLETGVAGTCTPPCYKDSELRQMLNASWKKWKTDGNFKMFAIFSYDPHRSDWDIFSSSQTKEFYQNTCTASGVNSGSFDANKFNNWFSSHQDQLVQCNETCGYAPSLSYCAATAFTPPEEGTGTPPARSGLDSRPFECNTCNKTDKMIGSCATSFTINDQVKYIRHESDNVCQNQYWLEKTWTGTVIVDPTQTTIPFVGKKGDENENKYLADYFEGTDKYYYFYQGPIQILNHAGVWRKLAPKQTQDDLKRKMVRRSCGTLDQGIHNYQVISESGETAFLTEIANHLPPLETETNYKEKYEAWVNSDGGKWYQLWPAVPMFTREDTPGKIMPYLGAGVKDTFEIQDKEKSEIEKVPHLARLFEVTRAINQLLLPAAQEATGEGDSKNGPLVAAAKDNSFSQKSLLAAADCQNCLVLSIVNPSVSGGLLHYSLQICPSCSGYGTIGDVRMGACGDLSQVQSVAPGCFSSDHPAIAPPIPISCPGTATICENAQANRDVAPSCASRVVSTSCQVVVDAQCKIISPSCGAAPPPPPACGLPKPQDVNTCKRQSLTGDGDTICCSKIQAKLSAVDQFVNPVFEECEYASDGTLLNPSCNQEEKYDVNRKIGIALSHPYLEEIWNYSTNSIKGFFNLFRPHERPEFEATDASSRIKYDYISNSGKGSASPAEGDFYYPYLGGTQKAKEWVIRTLLPSTRTPTAASNVPSSDQLGYSIDITNTNQTIKDITRANVISAVKASWPNTKIEEKWDYVFQRAKESGFNPVFVLAIWIEESGASGVNAYDLGVEACNPNDLEDQLNCFSKITYKDTGFEEFMCMFAEGKHHVCRFEKAVNFPGNLKYWYDALTK